jgi:hypothetical protein
MTKTSKNTQLKTTNRPAGRTCWAISNDISEGLPVTKAEVIRVLRWERQNADRRLVEINRLRDGLVKIGLMLVGLPIYTRQHNAIFKRITKLLKPGLNIEH